MNPYAIIAALVLFGAALAGTGYEAYSLGIDHQSAKDAAAFKAADEQHAKDVAAARSAERQLDDSVASLATTYEKEKTDAALQNAHTVAALRAALAGLRDRLTAAAQRPGVPKAATHPSGTDAAGQPDVLDQVASSLGALAGEADDDARRLNLCEDTLKAERTPAPARVGGAP